MNKNKEVGEAHPISSDWKEKFSKYLNDYTSIESEEQQEILGYVERYIINRKAAASSIEDKRWINTDAFVAACKAAEAISSISGNGVWTIEEINTFQELLKEQGFAILPVEASSISEEDKKATLGFISDEDWGETREEAKEFKNKIENFLAEHEPKKVLGEEDIFKTALEKIEQMSDPGSYERAIVEMKSIATEALRKVKTESLLPNERKR